MKYMLPGANSVPAHLEGVIPPRQSVEMIDGVHVQVSERPAVTMCYWRLQGMRADHCQTLEIDEVLLHPILFAYRKKNNQIAFTCFESERIAEYVRGRLAQFSQTSSRCLIRTDFGVRFMCRPCFIFSF